ncbi:MAG TPA: endonuclease domain-containing protein [Sphingomicrobium sp.]
MATQQNPPRNGEGDHAQHGGGAERRAHHRTVGASDANIRRARQLRRKLTLPEVVLWQHLRKRPDGLRFRRQFPFGGYVIDFACLKRRLAIEVDGEAHSMGNNPSRDLIRDRRLAEAGFETLRIAVRDVLDNLEGTMTYILAAGANRPLHHDAARRGPPPRSGED